MLAMYIGIIINNIYAMILIDLKTLIKLEIEKLLSVLFFFRLVSPINKVLAKTNTASKMKTNEYDNRSDIRPPITMPQLYPAIFPAAIVDKSLTRKSAFFSNIAHNFVDEINAAMPKPSTPLANENLNKFNNGKVISLGSENDLKEIAKNLFEALRKCDDLGVQYILCQGFEENGVGLAIMNRLNKAAGYDILEV